MSFDHDLLDNEQLLLQRDDGRLLWSLARAGAQVRRAVDVAAEFDLQRLAGGDPPRAILLVGDPPCAGALRVLSRLLVASAPTIIWSGVDLPRWAGPADALLAASWDGRHPRVSGIVSLASRRGLATCIVAPEQSPVAELAGHAPVAHLEDGVHPRSALWAVLTPLLQAADALGCYSLASGQLAQLADGLDSIAEMCRPSSDAFTNPAKAMAAEFAQGLPVIAGVGSLPGVAARLFADALRLIVGWPAASVTLPDGMAPAVGLLTGERTSTPEDFYRDRVDESGSRPPRLVVIGDDEDSEGPAYGPRSAAQVQLDDVAARRSAAALQEMARDAGLRSSALDLPIGTPLTRFGAATSFGLFTAAYLALGLGLDPSVPRPGELLQ